MTAKHESVCNRCAGAGLVKPSPDQQFVAQAWGVRVCPGCNGHGTVIFDGRKVIKYEMDAQVKVIVFGGLNA